MTGERVLIVEDEALAADTYGEYLARAGGYQPVHLSPTLADAVRFLSTQWREHGSFGVDLVLLDMNLPDGHGLEVLRRMRSAGFAGAVVAMTAATDVPTIRQAMALGVIQYLVKPFGYPEFAERLRAARELSTGLAGTGSVRSQAEVDRAFRHHGSTGPATLPKGLTEGTLDAIVDLLRSDLDAVPRPAPDSSPRTGRGSAGAEAGTVAGRSAGEVGAAVGTSRVTARRYLEHLFRQGLVDRSPRYGTPGRPENEYRWSGRGSAPG
ncbi:response regulator [Citricoccus sp. K5]|uniref:response regulator n=1 Tax=Citricoccus sp. K5 TaxID=2653135 RepID=UPI0012EFBE2E|nr:response regulator [Citricoccus sp. K5]VXB48220.1 Response regulator of citrate/malate metabolism [Citricoccus sp. K5]